jgi:hypothetical protein
MYDYNMKKSIVVHQLPLPQDTINSICSFKSSLTYKGVGISIF